MESNGNLGRRTFPGNEGQMGQEVELRRQRDVEEKKESCQRERERGREKESHRRRVMQDVREANQAGGKREMKEKLMTEKDR